MQKSLGPFAIRSVPETKKNTQNRGFLFATLKTNETGLCCESQ
jgi:hypothetical protein